MYDKSNVIVPTLITEINQLIFLFTVLSATLIKKSANEVVKIISFYNPLKFSLAKNTIKNTLGFQLTNIDVTLLPLEDKKVHRFFFNRKKKI